MRVHGSSSWRCRSAVLRAPRARRWTGTRSGWLRDRTPSGLPRRTAGGTSAAHLRAVESGYNLPTRSANCSLPTRANRNRHPRRLAEGQRMNTWARTTRLSRRHRRDSLVVSWLLDRNQAPDDGGEVRQSNGVPLEPFDRQMVSLRFADSLTTSWDTELHVPLPPPL